MTSRLGLLICLATLGACGGGSDSEQPAPESPLITLNAEADAWPTAEIRGSLTEREGCLLIGDSVAVFPFGTVWQPPEVVFEDGHSVRVGSEVSMGGGGFTADEVTAAGLPLVPADQVLECARRTSVTTFVWARP